MALILAIQTDASYAGTVRQVLCESPDNEIRVVGSIDEALDAIDQEIPDLVLVDALTPAGEVEDLVAYLRMLPDTHHVQTISVPLIQNPADFLRSPGSDARPGWLKHLLKRPARPAGRPVGWTPELFAADVGDYLARMHTLRSEEELRKAILHRAASERRRARRWQAGEVSYIAAHLMAARGELVNISTGGALVRTSVRPRRRRDVAELLNSGPSLTLLQASGATVLQPGRAVRCHVRTIGEGILYDVAFQFSTDLEIALAEVREAASSRTTP